jgi:chromosome partitioning protein
MYYFYNTAEGALMKATALANMKGGVGKTSISVSLAAELAQYGKTVLLDFDPQANSTAWTAPDEADIKHELSDVLQGRVKAKDALIPTDTERLWLLPTFGIAGELKGFIENAGELQINKAVRDLISGLAKAGFVFCVIDLSPAFGKLERAALISADEAVTPILPDRFSLDGLESIAGNLKELQSLVDRPIAKYKRIIINGIDGRIKRHSKIVSDIKAAAAQSIYTVPIDQVFFRAQSASRPIQFMDAKQETLDEISRLALDVKKEAV